MVRLVLALNISVCLKLVPFVSAFDNLKKNSYTKREREEKKKKKMATLPRKKVKY